MANQDVRREDQHTSSAYGDGGTIQASYPRIIGGRADYLLGSHPLWQFFRCGYQMLRLRTFLQGMFCLSGYLSRW